MGQHRHPRIGLYPRHQSLAAARNDQVDQPGRRQHRADRGTILHRHQLHRVLRRAALDQPAHQCGVQRPVRMDRLASPTQHTGIARAQAQHGSVDGHIGAAFVDDPDQPDRHPDLIEHQPIGALDPRNDRANRIGQRGNLLDRDSNRLQPRGIERKPIKHRGAEPIGPPGHKVARIGGQNGPRIGPQCGSGSAQRTRLSGIAQPRQFGLCSTARHSEASNQRLGRFGMVGKWLDGVHAFRLAAWRRAVSRVAPARTLHRAPTPLGRESLTIASRRFALATTRC